MRDNPQIDSRGTAAIAWYKGRTHRFYEDSFRLLNRDVPVVDHHLRGEIYAVFDGIGSAPKGQSAAIAMADALLSFFTEPETFENSINGLKKLLHVENLKINDWGFIPGSTRPIGGCCGSIAWCHNDCLTIFHAGDTTALHLSGDRYTRLSIAHQNSADVITRYFGQGQKLEIDISSTPIEPYDQILLYSDGISKVLCTEEVMDIIMQFEDPKRRATTLASVARAKGSGDDITVLCAEIPDEDE